MDNTHYGPENGQVYFTNDEKHRIQIQSRQDGVSIDTILLSPYRDIDRILKEKKSEGIDQLLSAKEWKTSYPDLVVISASDIENDHIHGKWKRMPDPSTLFNYRLDDLPPEKWQFQPLIDPEDYFEARFSARGGEKYRIWIRLKAHRGSPKNDSVYVQFDDAVDENGRAIYRIGKPAFSNERIKGIDLILTGHTHGGQVRIPLFGPLTTMTSMGDNFISTLHKVGKTFMYVSRGFGYSSIPIRLFCPPEITVFSFH
jgi:hypothetical protein